MRRVPTWSLVVLLAACEARLSDAPSDSGPARDAALDAVRFGPWSLPNKVVPAATPANEDDVTLSSDGLEMFFAVADANGKDLYYTSRSSPVAPWAAPAMKLPFDTTDFSEETPRLSADDRTLYFASDRGGNGTLDIYSATRPGRGSLVWANLRPIDVVNTTTAVEKWFMPCGTDGYVMVQSNKTDTELVEGKLGGADPTPIDELNSTANETGTFLTADCLTIYFASARVTPVMIYTSHRASLTSKWDPPMMVRDFESIGGGQEDPWLSPDARTFAFASDASGSKDIYITTR